MKNRILLPIYLIFCPVLAYGQVIDMHLHAYTEQDFWVATARNGFAPAESARDLLEQTIRKMDEHAIEFAVVSGNLESLAYYTQADDRFVPSYQDYDADLIPVDSFLTLVRNGDIQVFGEVMAVYHGQTLNDEKYQPYLKICEEYNIPVAYHTGGTFPGANASIWKKFRLSLGDPLLIEDVLVRYPKLKVSLMHAGSNFYANTLRMMDQYPQLYADLGVLLWLHPVERDYAVKFLELVKAYGVLDRVMFGSDQMIWPDAITESIEYLESLAFLTESEKQDILYHNAKRFLNMGE
ncbi:hypothetical protein GGR26_000067 [Lewinella marina]|uniref:Amidohydrolase-related domain-containing protein n=1 Tax=Neolewinella marina TaxID=438751 RepID=A0A2G0CKI2_9BACT|nr:amidohydrolase family protein [Neolewinella marina]NJB84322.1 hypothetical protein [Neolewinella marina]PHL00477.1 hypothetical protein CGL56_05450 [Neolewinella marina]